MGKCVLTQFIEFFVIYEVVKESYDMECDRLLGDWIYD